MRNNTRTPNEWPVCSCVHVSVCALFAIRFNELCSEWIYSYDYVVSISSQFLDRMHASLPLLLLLLWLMPPICLLTREAAVIFGVRLPIFWWAQTWNRNKTKQSHHKHNASHTHFGFWYAQHPKSEVRAALLHSLSLIHTHSGDDFCGNSIYFQQCFSIKVQKKREKIVQTECMPWCVFWIHNFRWTIRSLSILALNQSALKLCSFEISSPLWFFSRRQNEIYSIFSIMTF